MTKNKSFRICPLASGSKGNSLFISGNNSAILIDAGLSGIELERRLKQINVDPQHLTAIIITHEHSDHVKGAGILNRRFNIPIYITRKTLGACRNLGKIQSVEFFTCGSPFEIDGIRINPFSISHDARDPVGLTLEYNGQKIGIATDLGIVTNLVRDHLKNCSVLYLESNHDPQMLMNGPYPWHLKQRIKDRHGHLSNLDARDLVEEMKTKTLKHVILAHLSKENNHPEIAVQEVKKSLNSSEIKLHVAHPDRAGQLIHI